MGTLKHRTAWALGALLTLGLTGCGGLGTDDLFGDSGNSVGAGGAGQGGASASQTSGAQGGFGGQGGAQVSVTSGPGSTVTTGGPGSTASTGVGPGPASSSASSSAAGGGCTVSPNDKACVKCSKQACCSSFEACENDQACICWSACIAQNPNNPGACNACGNFDNVTQSFLGCIVGQCKSECETSGTSTSSSSASTGGGPGSSSSTSSTSVTSSSASGGTNACTPQALDKACTKCAKADCCSEVTACTGDPNCICWSQCSLYGGSATLCAQICQGQPDDKASALFACTGDKCASDCQ